MAHLVLWKCAQIDVFQKTKPFVISKKFQMNKMVADFGNMTQGDKHIGQKHTKEVDILNICNDI